MDRNKAAEKRQKSEASAVSNNWKKHGRASYQRVRTGAPKKAKK